MLMYMRRVLVNNDLNNVVIMYEYEVSESDEVSLLLEKMYVIIMTLCRKYASLCILYV